MKYRLSQKELSDAIVTYVGNQFYPNHYIEGMVTLEYDHYSRTYYAEVDDVELKSSKNKKE